MTSIRALTAADVTRFVLVAVFFRRPLGSVFLAEVPGYGLFVDVFAGKQEFDPSEVRFDEAACSGCFSKTRSSDGELLGSNWMFENISSGDVNVTSHHTLYQ